MYHEFLRMCDWVDALPNFDFVAVLAVVSLVILALCMSLDWLS